MIEQPTQVNGPGANKTILTNASDAATAALDTVVTTAQGAARRTAQGVDDNPLAVLAGGIAVGLIAGALLPRTDRETALLGPLGKRLADGATVAVRAARDAGGSELVAAGISKAAARAQVDKLIEGMMTAVKTAGDAAVTAAKTPPTQN